MEAAKLRARAKDRPVRLQQMSQGSNAEDRERSPSMTEAFKLRDKPSVDIDRSRALFGRAGEGELLGNTGNPAPASEDSESEAPESEAGSIGGAAGTAGSELGSEEAVFEDIAENFEEYDEGYDRFLNQDEINSGLEDKTSEENINGITEELGTLQLVNGKANNANPEDAEGPPEAEDYENITINDVEAIQERLADGDTLDDVTEEIRSNELTEDYYIPTGDDAFEAKVEDLAGELDVRVIDSEIPNDNLVGDPGGEEASTERRKVIAREILETYENRPDLIEEVLDDQDLKIFLSTAENDEGGSAREKPATILGQNPAQDPHGHLYLDLANTQGGVNDEDDGNNVISHEFGHFVDFENNSNIDDNDTYKDIRDEFKERFEEEIDANFDGETPDFSDSFWGEDSVIPGLDNYAFFSDEEFFAVVTELYQEDPEQLRTVSPELYDVVNGELGLYG